MEYEKNVNNYLFGKFTDPLFHLNSELEAIQINQKAEYLLKQFQKIFFKDFAKELINADGNSLTDVLFINPEFENSEFNCKINETEAKKFIISSSAFSIEQNRVIIIILKDVTQLYSDHEKKLSLKYQNILLFSAPHEIRSQLNQITGNLEQIEKKHDPLLLKIARFAARVMECKLNILFDFVHLTTNTFSAHLKKFNFKEFIEDTTSILNHYAKSKNLNFIIKYKTHNNILNADIERFFSIIIHIVLNAIKYTDRGNIVLKMQYLESKLYTKVIDSGPGMNPSLIKHIN